MADRFRPLADAAEQILLRALADHRAARAGRDELTARAAALAAAVETEARRSGPESAAAFSRYAEAAAARRRRLEAEAAALAPAVKATREAALAALGRSRAVEILAKRERAARKAARLMREERDLGELRPMGRRP